MSRLRRLGVAALAWGLISLAAPPALAGELGAIAPAANGVTVGAKGVGEPRAMKLRNPDRWVVDFPDAAFPVPYRELAAPAGGVLKRVRVGRFGNDTTRMVLDCAKEASLSVVKTASGYRLALGAPAAAQGPVLTGVTARPGGALRVALSSRRPYWSHAEGRTLMLVFPGVSLAPALKRPGALTRLPNGTVARYAQGEGEARVTFTFARPGRPEIGLVDQAWQVAWEAEPAPGTSLLAGGLPDAPLTFKRVSGHWELLLAAPGRAFRAQVTPSGDDRFKVRLEGARLGLPRDSVYVDDGLIARVRVEAASPSGMTLVVDLDQAVGFTGKPVAGGRGFLMSFAPLDQTKATLDPGHGGADAGAVGAKGTREKDVTFAIATKLARQMAAGGISVQLTRLRDVEVLLRPRVELANRQDSDLFISIHANAFPNNRGVAGIETYYFSDQAQPLASAIHKHLVASLKRPDRGVRRNNFYVTHHTKMPAALVEIGYLTNPEEEALLGTSAYQERAAQAIYAGVKEYLAKRPQL